MNAPKCSFSMYVTNIFVSQENFFSVFLLLNLFWSFFSSYQNLGFPFSSIHSFRKKKIKGLNELKKITKKMNMKKSVSTRTLD